MNCARTLVGSDIYSVEREECLWSVGTHSKKKKQKKQFRVWGVWDLKRFLPISAFWALKNWAL